MTIRQQLTEDMKTAMKAREAAKLQAIRYLMSVVKNAEIDAGGELTDAQIQDITRKQIKQMKDAITEFEKGGRMDLVEEENAKIAVFENYIPAGMTSAELESLVDSVIAAQEAPTMGSVIAAVRAQSEGRADGGQVAQLVKQKLG